MSNDTIEDNAAAEVERIRGRIESLINDHFARGEPIFYLSRLGTQLGHDRARLEKLTGAKLAAFVRDGFDYEMAAEGQHNNVLFLKSKTGTARALPTPRYVSRFWAAFAIPLKADESRYIDLDTLNFGPDRNALGGPDADIRQIGEEFIAPREASGSAADTATRIARWLDSETLEADRFLAKRRKAKGEGKTALEALLNALDGDQLRRVDLPLDVVKALLEKPA